MPANPAASRNPADRVQVAPVEGADALFTPAFREYLVRMHDDSRRARTRCGPARRVPRAGARAGGCPGRRRERGQPCDWKVPPVPEDLRRPGIEISGPCSITSMFINALNPGRRGSAPRAISTTTRTRPAIG